MVAWGECPIALIVMSKTRSCRVGKRHCRVPTPWAVPCPYTLGYRVLVENEDGVFIPSRETGFLNLILGKAQKLSHKPGFLHRF
ncbi:MAG: hypothetical protein ACRCT1_20990 [Microcoleaceae cyanobacterium]